MKKHIVVFIAVLIVSQVSAQIYVSRDCKISFLSKTAIEDIKAVNKKTIPFINIKTGAIQMKIAMTSFVFEKPLMQEHFNENYIESEKYPYAIFKGVINEKVDYTKDSTYTVTVTGKLMLHGVEKERTMKGTLIVKGNKITLSSTFKIVFTDHNIIIPKLYKAVFPPDTEVKIDAVFIPYKKKE